MNRIFPIEIMENSEELHRYRHLKKESRNLYYSAFERLIFNPSDVHCKN